MFLTEIRLPNLNSHHPPSIIFAGDLNCVMDPALGCLSSMSLSPSKMAQTLSPFFNKADDLIKLCHPLLR